MSEDSISRDAVLDACSQSINILDAMSRIEDLPSVTPNPCEDAISRQAAINVVSGIDRHFVKYIKELPSATPKQRTGHWEWDGMDAFLCSECASGYKEQPTMMGKPMFEYCPICGAKMEEQT